MNCKKWIVVGATAVVVAGMSAQADISFQYNSAGGWLPGGDFANGPYPEVGFLYQVLWSPTDPSGNAVNPGGAGPGSEVVLLENFSRRDYGYVYLGDDPAIVVTSARIGGGNPNADGFVYSRVFENAGAPAGAWYSQSAPVSVSSFPVYDPQLPTTIGTLTSPAGLLDRQVVPEPSTGLLLALSGLVLAVRRRYTR